jgi:hypothetical protein
LLVFPTRHDLATADAVPALNRFDVDSTASDETWGMGSP